jgi:hypothetical protein
MVRLEVTHSNGFFLQTLKFCIKEFCFFLFILLHFLVFGFWICMFSFAFVLWIFILVRVLFLWISLFLFCLATRCCSLSHLVVLLCYLSLCLVALPCSSSSHFVIHCCALLFLNFFMLEFLLLWMIMQKLIIKHTIMCCIFCYQNLVIGINPIT